MPEKEYDFRNCRSLFGYAAEVHSRSGGICQLCGAGTNDVDFDGWRQLTVEHLIGDSQGGYLQQITKAVDACFPGRTADMRAALARQIDEANIVTACSFCNATTSRERGSLTMREAIGLAAQESPDAVVDHLRKYLQGVLASKRRDVSWKLASVRKAFDSTIVPALTERRAAEVGDADAVDADEVGALVERIRVDVAAEWSDYVPPRGYADISLALVDAVYSIQMRYTAVRRVVTAYASASGIPDRPLAAAQSSTPPEGGLSRLLERASALSGMQLADHLFGGSRSKTRGRLKADVCADVASRLIRAGVTTRDDLREQAADPRVRSAWTGTTGLAWVTWQYFCMLNGLDGLKPDVTLIRFVTKTLGRPVSATETERLLVSASDHLRRDHPDLNRRTLDHTLWRFESGRA